MKVDSNDLARAGRRGSLAEAVSVREDRAIEARRRALEQRAPLVGGFLAEALELMRRRASGDALPVLTPWPSINQALGGGLWPGLHTLVGPTGTGKTQLALQIAWAAAHQGSPVLYIALELGREELAARLLSLAMREDDPRAARWSDLYFGRVSTPEIEAIASRYSGALSALPFRIETADAFGWTAGQLRERAEAIAEAHRLVGGSTQRPPLIVLDYLQLVAPEEVVGRRQELRERIGAAAYAGRMAARDLGAAVLAISSVSRENARLLVQDEEGEEERRGGHIVPLGKGDPYRLVGLGKESGEVEFSSDSVVVLGRGPWRPGAPTEMHLAIAKLRGGSPSWHRLMFDGGSLWEPREGVRPCVTTDSPRRALFDE